MSQIPKRANHFVFVVMRQYSSTGNVPGIAGSVNLDRFNRSAADLSAFASH